MEREFTHHIALSLTRVDDDAQVPGVSAPITIAGENHTGSLTQSRPWEPSSRVTPIR
ncbi:hypothetical protein [Deinococcus multiflagellatus]|uniref:Uncharacterized protein n=1 Tax=Deinococcus multiflagellatus TaxID=1656887 RepID=A0ABW1ZI53_9DEIO